MKTFLMSLVFLLVAFSYSCSSSEEHGPEYEKRLKKVEMEVDKIMEMMDLPEYGLVKMSSEGLYLEKDYKKAATDMLHWGRKMKDLDHPDKKFMEMTDDMLKAFDSFEAAINKKDKEEIASSWKVVYKTCKDCHDVYE